MPNLRQSLQNYDLGHLRIVAELWGLELDTPEKNQTLEQLASALREPNLVEEVIEALPEEARKALEDLLHNGGRLSWSRFTRQYGEVREMGTGRRDRERPFLNPVSAAETLWYRALVARAFFDTSAGPEEFVYVPEDLIPFLPGARAGMRHPLGRPATPQERAQPIQLSDRVLDDSCTLLAALRLEIDPASCPSLREEWQPSTLPLQQLLATAGLLDSNGLPQAESTRAFLEASRGEALVHLSRAWLESTTFNELRLIPDLQVEGEWENDPLRARQAVLGFLSTVPRDVWWSLDAFVAAIRQHHPDYQRPAGDYDSWFIRHRSTGEYLRGFEHWEAVDGALVRYMIAGPLNWLGILNLAAPAPPSSNEKPTITAFRFSQWSAALLQGIVPQDLPLEEEQVVARSDAIIRVPRLAPRAVRYLIARFCEWKGEQGGFYRYRLTPASLERARSQSLRVSHLLVLLSRYAQAVPPTLVRALERWEKHGAEAHLERLLVLRLRSPEVLQELRTSHAARYLGDPLGSSAVIVKTGALEKLVAALAEMGYLADVELE